MRDWITIRGCGRFIIVKTKLILLGGVVVIGWKEC